MLKRQVNAHNYISLGQLWGKDWGRIFYNTLAWACFWKGISKTFVNGLGQK
jgi:hypothetical protein